MPREYVVFSRVLIIALVVWLTAAYGIAPWLLERIYLGELPGGDRLMGARAAILFDEYLADWWRIATRLSFGLITLEIVAILAWVVVRPPGRGPESSGDGLDEGPAGSKAAALSVSTAVLLGGWFGLLGGMGESYYMGARWLVLREPVPSFLWFSQHSLWMTPAVTTLVYAGFGALMALVARAIRRPLLLRWLVAGLGFAVTLTWVAQTGRIRTWTAVLLCAGIALRASSRIAARPERYRGFIRATAVGGLAIVIGVATGIPLIANRRERSAAEIAEGSPSAGPNLLLIVLDTQRAASTSVYSAELGTTPNLERWARRGVVYEMALATTSWTLPSHASMFTGRYNFELKTGEVRPLGSEFPTLAEHLGANGYATAGFVANIAFCSDLFGLGRGFQRYRDQPLDWRMAVSSPMMIRGLLDFVRTRMGLPPRIVRKRAPAVGRDLLDWLDSRDRSHDGRPFFAFLNYFDAHAPYEPPRDFVDPSGRLSRARAPFTRPVATQSGAEARERLAAYHRGIRYVDHHIGKLLDELDARHLLDSTIVIITADHGEAFGEHGYAGHKRTVFVPEIQVPLILLGPSVGEPGSQVTAPVSLRDLPATAMDLLGLEGPFPGSSWLGASLTDTILAELDEYPTGDALMLHAPNWWAIHAGRLSLVRQPDGVRHLFDLSADPWQQHDLADAEELGDALERLTRALDARTPGVKRGNR